MPLCLAGLWNDESKVGFRAALEMPAGQVARERRARRLGLLLVHFDELYRQRASIGLRLIESLEQSRDDVTGSPGVIEPLNVGVDQRAASPARQGVWLY